MTVGSRISSGTDKVLILSLTVGRAPVASFNATAGADMHNQVGKPGAQS